ncbi:hypothetical protein OnM2_031021 [Erysiphe neolycopersici]|uniref:Cysteine-rich PDZ-binding protein n=1 Tax=Erysiphe neolycopersici TaxID=212602 RepID=A0A420HZ79_9PEZI|nr:hypothetical protein OnM2_031021 [Erysiphe neolycopersici]
MVCSKCQKLARSTTLATPEVKKKNDIYYGSSARNKSGEAPSKSSSTLGYNGIGKSKLLSKAAKNPYASSSCRACKTRIEQGKTYCQKCAYKANACWICGKANSKSTAATPIIEGQKFNLN